MKNNRCYAKISIKNLISNLDNILSLLPDGCKLIPVIKADAYGHGAVEFAKALGNKYMFAVATLGEALELRRNGIENEILVLGVTPSEDAHLLAENNITQTVADLDYAKSLKSNLKVHIKLDTGMSRLGFNKDNLEDILELKKLKNLEITGVFSHFAESDNLSSDFTDLQFSRFKEFTSSLDIPFKHICNSAGILAHPDKYLSAVRAGIILYGAYPSKEVKKKYLSLHSDKPFREVMTFVSKVAQVHSVKKGEYIGYSRTYKAERDITVATVSAGYADGIPRALSNKGRVKINGETFNIVGNVCMDLLMVDVTDSKSKVKRGDEVLFWGEEGITIDEYADLCGTISYEIYTKVTKRVDRVYE